MKKTLGALIFALSLLAVGHAGWAAAPAAPVPAAPTVVVAQPGCQPVLDLTALSPQGETCRTAAAPKAQAVPQPEFLITGGKTCRCSCGYPCKTDADCGGALGSCRAGITCC